MLKIWDVVKARIENYPVRVERLSKQKKQCRLVVNMMGFRNEGLSSLLYNGDDDGGGYVGGDDDGGNK